MEPSEAENVQAESPSGQAARPGRSVPARVVVGCLRGLWMIVGWIWLMMWIALFGHMSGVCLCVAIGVLLNENPSADGYYVVFATGSGSLLLWLLLRTPWKGNVDVLRRVVRGLAAIPFFALLATIIVTFVVYAFLDITGQLK